MEVLITSKTHKGKVACVGGLVINNNRLVRLLNPGSRDQYTDTDLHIGDVWDIGFQAREDVEPPHIEDVIIHSKKHLGKIERITDFIINCGITIHRGAPNHIFEGTLRWTGSGSGFIEENEILPSHSVGFWISDRDLNLEPDEKHYCYSMNNIYASDRRFAYVGFEPVIDIIPAGTLLRVSLARWWKPENSDMNERCYLQLSGWYR
ncbi:hypothetical protein MASR2M47_09620 [Draconibacterium sp.]